MADTFLKNPQLEGGAFYWEAGPVGVLLCHGLTATAAEVRPFAKRLLELGYTVAGPLLPGHGATPQELNRTHWQDWVAAAESTYQQLAQHCEQIVLGGESAGAVIALYLASRHPEAVAVLAYAPAIKLALSPFDEFRMRLFAPFILGVPKGGIDREDHWQGYRINPLKAAIQLVDFGKGTLQRLPSVKQPLLVMQGRYDTTIDPNASEIVLEDAGSEITEMYWLEESTHVVLLDVQVDEITTLTDSFIKQVLAEKTD